jgi:hypothetical protein
MSPEPETNAPTVPLSGAGKPDRRAYHLAYGRRPDRRAKQKASRTREWQDRHNERRRINRAKAREALRAQALAAFQIEEES